MQPRSLKKRRTLTTVVSAVPSRQAFGQILAHSKSSAVATYLSENPLL
jgi:hypothetical protein